MSDLDQYKFTIINDQVTEVFEWSGGIWELDSIESNETYEVSGTDVIKTEDYGTFIETKTYSDSDQDGIYKEIADNSSDGSDDSLDDSSNDDHREYQGESYSSDRYVVDLNDTSGEVIGFWELEDGGVLENEMEFGATYEIIDGILYETEPEQYGIEVKTYEDADGDGYWVKTSSRYIQNESQSGDDNSSGLLPTLTNLLGTQGSDDDDYLLMTEGGGVHGGLGGDRFVMRDLVNCRMLDFDADEGDRIVFDTGYGLSGAEQLAQYVSGLTYDQGTQTLSVNFSGLASIEVLGVRADQISWDLCEILS